MWLQRRPVDFSIADAGYRLRAFRLGVVEIDLLSGWLRSRGRLPFLGVVVGGLELRVEALLSEGWDGGGAGKLVPHGRGGVAWRSGKSSVRRKDAASRNNLCDI